MKIKSFTYFKEKENITKAYKVLAIKEESAFLEGISLNDLTEEKQKEVIDIYKEFEEKLQPFMKQYRRFNKTSIVQINE